MLEGRLDGRPVRILDVSFGGMKGAIEILGESERLPIIGSEHPLELESKGFETVRFSVTVVRVNMHRGTFGARFHELNDQQYRNLEGMIMGRSPDKA